MVRAVSSVVAAVARATAIFALPSKLVPPIVLAVANLVAVAALPVMSSDVRASVPVLVGKVTVGLPEYDACAAASNLV